LEIHTVRNDSLNIIIGKSENMDDGNFQTSGVDLEFHFPYLDVYVYSSHFVFGGAVYLPMDDLRLWLLNVAQPVELGQLSLGNINIRVWLRCQIVASMFQIEQLLPNDSVLCKSVYGPGKGNEQLFDKVVVSRAMLDRLNK